MVLFMSRFLSPIHFSWLVATCANWCFYVDRHCICVPLSHLYARSRVYEVSCLVVASRYCSSDVRALVDRTFLLCGSGVKHCYGWQWSGISACSFPLSVGSRGWRWALWRWPRPPPGTVGSEGRWREGFKRQALLGNVVGASNGACGGAWPQGLGGCGLRGGEVRGMGGEAEWLAAVARLEWSRSWQDGRYSFSPSGIQP